MEKNLEQRVPALSGKMWIGGAAACLTLLLLLAFGNTLAQEPASPAPQSSQDKPAVTVAPSAPGIQTQPAEAKTSEPKQEVTMQEAGTTFKLRVNLVQVHVVVKDSQGKPIDNLKKEDFLLYDQGKLQSISTFAVETPATRRDKATAAAKTQVGSDGTEAGGKAILPDRFVALEFDDVHLTAQDAVYSRVSAGKFLDSLTPTDRVGIFTTSGEANQDFTSDVALLKQKLLAIIPRPKGGVTIPGNCPDVSPYVASLVQDQNDQTAFRAVVQDAWDCEYRDDPKMYQAALQLARVTIMQVANSANGNNNYTYRTLQDTLRRLSAMPGERVMLLVSPGFTMGIDISDMQIVVEQAIHSNIVINTLDARGLYTPDIGDIANSRAGIGPLSMYRIAAQSDQETVLADFANGTGGSFFHNSNDIAGGMTKLGSAPEVSYILGFSPQNQKMDGTFHTLKVKLAMKQKYELQARKGYYAPKKVDDPKEQAKQEIQEAVFSRDEIMDMPMELQTQYFKKTAEDAQLSVVTKLSLQGLHFRKADGRIRDNLTIATAVFDDNGNFVLGGEKTLDMKLLDTTYEKLMKQGLTVKSSFDVKPGKYMVRQVVRDAEGSQMAARNGAVDIPY